MTPIQRCIDSFWTVQKGIAFYLNPILLMQNSTKKKVYKHPSDANLNTLYTNVYTKHTALCL